MNGIKAQYFNKLENNKVHCILCPHNCHINNGERGICGVRKNIDGNLYAESYGHISSLALDPIEKKPLYHFYPGSLILSIGSYGCNLRCSFCQNYSISMNKPNTAYISPENLVYKAFDLKKSNNIGLAYTYNEPFISYEYVLDCCKLAKEKNLKNILVTNGYIQQEPLLEILPYIDAMNIDLKSFYNDFYSKICGGKSEFVKNTIYTAATKGCHVEVTTLIIPGLNDTDKEMEELSAWLSDISPDIPLHLTRFFPQYKLTDRNYTPKETLFNLEQIARKHLKYVHPGNI
ncbi:MAG: AmmeMemoRadiSam system radical SAM enzyme [Clostridiaceae bacterium]|nr:AmmeMemoRadiSam system radical SAM enzyme [Clostridiaceae bacterium]